MELDDETLHTLACDISIRPRNAAGIAELLPFLRSAKTDNNKVIILFDEAGNAALESFVGAERLCCTGLTWELAAIESGMQLTVTGNLEQVSIIKKWFELS